MHSKELLKHCAYLITQLLPFEQPADAVVARYFREQRLLGPRERSVVVETAYNVLRHKLCFERLAQQNGSPLPRALAILGFAGAPDLLQAALPPDEARWLADSQQTLASAESAEMRHNLPPWLEQTLRQEVGARFDALAAALLQPAPLDVRVNTLLTKRNTVLDALQNAGIPAAATPYSPWGIRLQGKPTITQTDLYRKGHIEVQDEGSQLLALLTDAKRNEMVVDFCAGAGGKTLALGMGMRNTGRLYACDISAHRLEHIKPRLARSGLNNVYPMAIADERDDRLQRMAGKIDRVLVDAPCSGLGTLRRNPDLKWRQTPQLVPELAQKQAAILRRAAPLLKSGGRLVYATCSLLRAENEAVAATFTAEQKMFMPLNAAEILHALKVPHAKHLCTQEMNADNISAGQYLRLWPDMHGTDGFFAAVWQKR